MSDKIKTSSVVVRIPIAKYRLMGYVLTLRNILNTSTNHEKAIKLKNTDALPLENPPPRPPTLRYCVTNVCDLTESSRIRIKIVPKSAKNELALRKSRISRS
jgi:hypothetical protein